VQNSSEISAFEIVKNSPFIIFFTNITRESSKALLSEIVRNPCFPARNLKYFNLLLLKHKFVCKSTIKHKNLYCQKGQNGPIRVGIICGTFIIEFARREDLANIKLILYFKGGKRKHEKESSSKLTDSSHGSNNVSWMRLLII
jgi:hypothetical protein